MKHESCTYRRLLHIEDLCNAKPYSEVAISEEVKFLTVPMATFLDTKQALYGIFEYVLTNTYPPQNSITITIQTKVS